MLHLRGHLGREHVEDPCGLRLESGDRLHGRNPVGGAVLVRAQQHGEQSAFAVADHAEPLGVDPGL